MKHMSLATAAMTALCLWWVRVELFGRAETKQEDVTLIWLATTKELICAMKTIKDSHYSVVLVEPVCVCVCACDGI